MDIAKGPQTPVVEVGNSVEGVVLGVVVVAGAIAVLGQSPCYGHMRDIEVLSDLLHGGDFFLSQPADHVLFSFREQ
jgi:hypothetical protein